MKDDALSKVDDNALENDVQKVDSDNAKETGKVAFKTYENVLKTVKKREEELRSIQEERDKLLQDKLEKEGKLTDLVDSLKQQVREKEEAIKSKESTFLQKTVLGKIKEKAILEGCVNPEKLIRLLSKDDLQDLDVDANTFDVNDESVQRLIAKAKQDHQDIGLFRGQKPSVKDAGTGGGTGNVTKSIAQMSAQELRELYIKSRKGN